VCYFYKYYTLLCSSVVTLTKFHGKKSSIVYYQYIADEERSTDCTDNQLTTVQAFCWSMSINGKSYSNMSCTVMGLS